MDTTPVVLPCDVAAGSTDEANAFTAAVALAAVVVGDGGEGANGLGSRADLLV